ncbi:MAG: thiolase family protein [Parvibaculales bacterium]
MSEVGIIGIGIHPFGRTPDRTGLEQGVYAIEQALKDVDLTWQDMQFAFGGSDAAGNADTMVSKLGLTGLQFINVKNGCATGGSSLYAASTAIKSGEYDIGLAVGFDKHPRGAFDPMPAEWGLPEWYGEQGYMLTTQFFAMKIKRYMHDYGISETSLGRVAEKSFINAEYNENAWRREPIALEEIMNSPMISDPLRKYMFCSPAEGAVALILANRKKAEEIGAPFIRLDAAVMRTRPPQSFEVFAPAIDNEISGTATQLAAKAAFEKAGIGPEDIDIAQLQDTESGAEIMHMAENGFCEHGEQEKMLENGETQINGRLPVNTDGGCIANGEPIGASGLRQVYENVLQLRGNAGLRQVQNNPRLAYTHVYGAPGVSAVTILSK